MSQEQPPIRSRRELRKARDAQQVSVPAGAEQVSPPVKPAAAKPSAATPPVATPPAATPADSPSGPRAAGAAPGQAASQRSSQIRARDRATLRTIKELEEKEGQLSAGGPPTRRQLRLQQLKEQALTAANPIVPPASGASDSAPASAPAAPGALGAPAEPRNSKPRPGRKKGDGAGESGSEGGKAPSQLGPDSPAPEGMTVEQALAARALIAEQAKNQIAKMEHIASLDPEAVDPEILAEQIALAERAAVMNRRAMAKQKLAEQAGGPLPPRDPSAAPVRDAGKKDQSGKKNQPDNGTPGAGQRPAPSTANNLAMVTPLEFVQVPGIDRPVMKPPATSHVPVNTRPGSRVTPSGTRKPRPSAAQRNAPADAGSGRSTVIARAEAAARAAARPQPVQTEENLGEDLFEGLPRIPASSAYGLEPLDAATAGLARAKRNRVLQVCILAFGVVALVSGILLIISGMSS